MFLFVGFVDSHFVRFQISMKSNVFSAGSNRIYFY